MWLSASPEWVDLGWGAGTACSGTLLAVLAGGRGEGVKQAFPVWAPGTHRLPSQSEPCLPFLCIPGALPESTGPQEPDGEVLRTLHLEEVVQEAAGEWQTLTNVF